MTTNNIAIEKHVASQGVYWVFSDILVMVRRNLLRYIRLPQLLIFSTIQPVMFLLLFAYVFGGAIKTPGSDYINYLIPGIIVQTVIFGAMQTGIGLADDLTKGLIDRFRSLPMARSAVLAGRTIADSIRNIFVVLLMSGVGLIIGFRSHESALNLLGALALTVLFGFSFSWISATIGILVKNVETAQVAGFIWVFPLVFASSIFVPVASMPAWLQAFAKISPITLTVNAVRALSLGLPLGNSLLYAILWIVGILGVFVPLAVYRYRRSN
jgi:ABC-2 type transport system permease protein/oleandomycin transport system permease protein